MEDTGLHLMEHQGLNSTVASNRVNAQGIVDSFNNPVLITPQSLANRYATRHSSANDQAQASSTNLPSIIITDSNQRSVPPANNLTAYLIRNYDNKTPTENEKREALAKIPAHLIFDVSETSGKIRKAAGQIALPSGKTYYKKPEKSKDANVSSNISEAAYESIKPNFKLENPQEQKKLEFTRRIFLSFLSEAKITEKQFTEMPEDYKKNLCVSADLRFKDENINDGKLSNKDLDFLRLAQVAYSK